MSNEKVNRILERSRDYINNNEKIKSLLETVKEKLHRVQQDSEERSTFISHLKMVIRMIQSHFNGSYPSFSRKSILLLIFSLVYFITPVDMIPDFVPALGFTDDISILYLVLKNIGEDIERYKSWEESKA